MESLPDRRIRYVQYAIKTPPNRSERSVAAQVHLLSRWPKLVYVYDWLLHMQFVGLEPDRVTLARQSAYTVRPIAATLR